MTAPIRPGTARRLGLTPQDPCPYCDAHDCAAYAEARHEAEQWAALTAAAAPAVAEAFDKRFGPTDAQKAAMFRRAMGADQ